MTMLAVKPTGNLHGPDLARAQAVQAERDQMACTGCGHKNVGHGHGEGLSLWPEGSRIGLGACSDCDCQAFGHEGLPQRPDTVEGEGE